MASRWLQPNAEKTNIIFFGPQKMSKQIDQGPLKFQIKEFARFLQISKTCGGHTGLQTFPEATSELSDERVLLSASAPEANNTILPHQRYELYCWGHLKFTA